MRAALFAILIAGAAWAQAPDAGVAPDAGAAPDAEPSPPLFQKQGWKAGLFGCERVADGGAPGEYLPGFVEGKDKREPQPNFRAEEDLQRHLQKLGRAKAPGPRPTPEQARAYEDELRASQDYLNGVGSEGRCWELTSDTAFGYRRVLTQHFEIARAFKLPQRSLAVVLRVNFGIDSQLSSGPTAIQGITASLGVRHFPVGGFSFEYGIRMIPGWSGPQDRDSELQALALGATLTSGLGNDTAWLPFSHTGFQLYADFQTRTGLWILEPGWALLLGARYGLAASLGNMQVHTWLGPQQAFVGNLYGELYLGLPLLRSIATGLQGGIHLDLSLSSVWPGEHAFPIVYNGFLGWSPATWISVRAFLGEGVSLASKQPGRMQYGARLQFYVP